MRAPETKRSPRTTALLITLCLLATVTALMQTMVVPVLVPISRELQISPSAVSWVVTANLLSAAVFTPVLSKAGDVHGRRKLVLAVIAAIAVGSLLAATTTSLALLIIARVLQGASFCLFPLSIGILRQMIPSGRLPLAISIVAGAVSVGAGAGLIITGVLANSDRSYHVIFWFTLVLALFLWGMSVTFIPRIADVRSDGTVDWVGGLLLGSWLALILLVAAEGSGWGWLSKPTLMCAALGAVVFAVWLITELRVTEPVVPLYLLRDRTLVSMNFVSFAIGFGTFLVFIALTVMVQQPRSSGYGLNASILKTSLVYLLPAAAIGIVASPLGGYMVNRYGGRQALVFSSLLGAIGFSQLLVLHTEPWHIISGGLLTNTAFNLAYAALPTVIVSIAPRSVTATATAMATIARSIGSSAASTFVLALVANKTDPNGVPEASVFVAVFAIGAVTMALAAVASVLGVKVKTENGGHAGVDPT